MKETMTIEEGAQALGIDKECLRACIKAGTLDIPHFMNGNRIMILTRRFYRDFLGADVESIRKMMEDR